MSQISSQIIELQYFKVFQKTLFFAYEFILLRPFPDSDLYDKVQICRELNSLQYSIVRMGATIATSAFFELKRSKIAVFSL